MSVKALNARTGIKETIDLPRDGSPLRWYTCGPTVYDAAHLGHARMYVSTDIIRRILVDYLRANVVFAMNVTDYDTKIIVRARRNLLVSAYVSSGVTHEQMVRDTNLAFIWALDRLGGSDNDTTVKHKAMLDTKARAAVAAKDELVGVCREVLGEWLEFRAGELVELPHEVFRAHAAHYERAFFDDMRELGVRPPDVLTRVSEYVPHIIAYVERIIANGFAYELDGSVYFDTQAFRATGFDPCKLAPEEKKEDDDDDDERGRKSPTDFVVWKARQKGEPAWPSPWGQGRPGWHIEVRKGASR